MDTAFALTLVSEDAVLADSAAQACFDRIDALELTLTKFNDTSDVAVIRALEPGAVATVSREIVDLLVVCAEVCAATAGAFDPTVERRNFSDLVIDVERCRIAVKGRVELDFGGIGKGFALDACRKILEGEQFGLDNWLLDAGTSTVLVSGGPWPLGHWVSDSVERLSQKVIGNRHGKRCTRIFNKASEPNSFHIVIGHQKHSFISESDYLGFYGFRS